MSETRGDAEGAAMKRIPLRDRYGNPRAYALVDDEDYERFGGIGWCLRGGTSGYVVGSVEGRMEYLHRVVLGLVPGDGLEADHLNHDGLDCRRENLRVVSHAANQQNRSARPGARSRFRGVSWFRLRRCWRARYGAVTVGYRRSEVEAAELIEAYRAAHYPFALPDPELAGWPAGRT